MTFDQDKNKVVLDGDAVVREGVNVIRGERITFYVEEERSVVEPTKGGVSARALLRRQRGRGREKTERGKEEIVLSDAFEVKS